jgi:serine protease
MSYKVVATPRLAVLKKAVSSAFGLCTFFVAVGASAATVEFKLAPDLKGREYRQALNGIAELGKLSTTGRGTYSIETANDVAANSALRNLREKRSVLWASVPYAAAASPNAADTASEFDARVVAFDLKPGSDAAAAVKRIAAATGHELRLKRVSANDRALVVMPSGMSSANMAAAMVAAENDGTVIRAERVRLASHQWLPNDALYSQQWALGKGAGGISAYDAWDITPSGSVQIAIIDTGIRMHPDLDGKRVVGYDMITEEFISADGDGRDNDPSDPGDTDAALECGRPRIASSWHGTHVAGIAAATANNAVGMSGVSPNSRIQSVRALGHCGGTEEDVADSIRWASGAPVRGVPTNPMPSRILNLSLGSNRAGACSANMQSAVDAALAQGAIVVAAAGNSADVANYWPANCRGVISVASTDFLGELSSFSNYGGTVAISAPGGENRVAGSPGVLSTLNGGTTLAGAPSYAVYSGTSMASPHVAGAVALMLARDPSLSSGQVLNRLQVGARAFPGGSECSGVSACGAGILNAANAVASVGLKRGINETSSSINFLHLVEMINVITARYQLSADPTEVERLVASGVWRRTGQIIKTYSFTTQFGDGSSVVQPVCRAMLDVGGAFAFSANTEECKNYQKTGSGFTPHGVVFAAALPNSNTCPTGSKPVWDLSKLDPRGYNVRNIADTTEISAMLAQGWSYGRVAFCAPN